MSDPAPMTPERAVAELASGFPTRTPEYILDRATHAMKTLAAERLEYGVTAVIGGRRLIMSNTRHGNTMDGMGKWFPMKELAENFMREVTAPEPQLVCRRISTYWEAVDE